MTWPMHPADEFEAFSALIAAGKGIQDVAAHFGVSVLTAQRRLKLAALLIARVPAPVELFGAVAISWAVLLLNP